MAPQTKRPKYNREQAAALDDLWRAVKENRDAMHGTVVVMRDVLDLRSRLDSPPEHVAAVGISWPQVLGVLNVELAMEASAYTSSFERADQMSLDFGEGEEETKIEHAPYGADLPDVEA